MGHGKAAGGQRGQLHGVALYKAAGFNGENQRLVNPGDAHRVVQRVAGVMAKATRLKVGAVVMSALSPSEATGNTTSSASGVAAKTTHSADASEQARATLIAAAAVSDARAGVTVSVGARATGVTAIAANAATTLSRVAGATVAGRAIAGRADAR